MSIDLTVEQVEHICDAAELQYENVYADYSGRYMYGENCLGFDIDRYYDDGLLSIALVDVLGKEDGKAMVKASAGDSMGLGSIVYFPGWTCTGWAEAHPEDDGDDDD